MSAAQPYTTIGRAKPREPSADKDAFTGVSTLHPPAPRQIPLPEFYPRERTSTASFKAPVTAAGKKKMTVPPPPPPGTLTAAMGYISTPVKYISSIFSTTTPPTPEPPKIKERLFKIDLEREKEKEKQISPRLSDSMRTLQNVVVEEVVPSAKISRPPEKNQGSAWRRKNLMDMGMNAPLSPKPASKTRGQSLRRSTPASSPTPEMMSPLAINQVKITSSLNQNAFKVISKFPVEEPEKKKKKDPRKGTNQRSQNEVSNMNNYSKTNSKYPSSTPTKLNVPLPKDEYPMFPFPTMLPPRVPPPSYTIKSSSSAKPRWQEEMNMARRADTPDDVENEGNLSTALATTSDGPKLVSFPSSTVLRSVPAGGDTDSSSVDVEEELTLHETLGKPDMGELARVSRLDQLPPGGLSDASTLKNLFQDAKQVHGSLDNASVGGVMPNGRGGAIGVVLCAASANNPSPARMTTRREYKSPAKNMSQKRSPTLKDASYSPVKKPAPPIVIRSQVKDVQPVAAVATPKKEEALKRYPPQSGISDRLGQLSEKKTSKEIVVQNVHKSPSPSSKYPPRKSSPLRVEDKYKAAVEEKLGKLDQRRSRYSSWAKSHGRDGKSSPSHVNPIIVTKTKEKTNDRSPEKPKLSSPLNAAIIGAAVTTAAAAVSAMVQPAQEDGKGDKVSAPSRVDQTTKDDKVPKKSPSSWKMQQDKPVAVATSSHRSPSTAKVDKATEPAEEIASSTDTKPKRSLSGDAKEFIRKKVFKTPKENDVKVSAQDTSNAGSGSENKTADEHEELDCMENYCGDPARFFNAATMMGEIP